VLDQAGRQAKLFKLRFHLFASDGTVWIGRDDEVRHDPRKQGRSYLWLIEAQPFDKAPDAAFTRNHVAVVILDGKANLRNPVKDILPNVTAKLVPRPAFPKFESYQAALSSLWVQVWTTGS
jgi:hypothetical protein